MNANAETNVVGQRTSIPFELLFDIDQWNSFHKYLPVLVKVNSLSLFDVKTRAIWNIVDVPHNHIFATTPPSNTIVR
jgi:hypothetical protein